VTGTTRRITEIVLANFDSVLGCPITLKPVGLRPRIRVPKLRQTLPAMPGIEHTICIVIYRNGTEGAHQKNAETNAPTPEEASLNFARERGIARRNYRVPHVVVNRDHAALNQLFASCIPHLKRTAVRLLPTREDGEDALQDALLLGYRKLDQFKGESQFSTWMHSILVNAARSLLRRQRTRPRTSSIGLNSEKDEGFAELTIANPRSNPEQEYRRKEVSRVAFKLVKTLPSIYQPVVWLCDIRGLEMKDAAQKLHRPVGTIKSQLHRAHRLIREQLSHDHAPRHGRRPRSSTKHSTRRTATAVPKLHSQSGQRLRPEPLPKALWGHSAYQMLRRGAQWKQIRRDFLAAAENRCAACGVNNGPLSCQGTWTYDDRDTVATLTGFAIFCPGCAAATNIGRTIRHGRGADALGQLSRVNGMTLAEAQRLSKAAMKSWKERNGKQWRISVAGYLLDKYPPLDVLTSGNGVAKENHHQ
jgi:RNA polymerase sigma-70 factor, ECF subfamily